MGLLDILLPGNPISGLLDQNRGQLTGFFGGMAGAGNDARAAVQGAARGGQAGMTRDDAYSRVLMAEEEQKRKIAEQQAQQDKFREWLVQAAPEYVGMVDAGVPAGDVFNAVLKKQGVGGDENFFGTPLFTQDSAGNISVNQLGNQGTLKPLELPAGQTLAAPTKEVDTGTEIITFDRFGNELFRTPKQNRAAASETAGGTVEGRNAAEMAIQAPQMEANLTRLDAQTDNVIKAVDKALGQSSWDTTGVVGQVLGNIAGTPAFDLRETAKQIKANLGFAELQAMREASPTGGALGQVAVQELEALQSTLASLNPDQSEQQLRDNLKLVRDLLDRQKMYRRMAMEAKTGGASVPPQQAGGYTVLGVE